MKPGHVEDDHFPKGVYILTAQAGGNRGGMTASWVCRAAGRPPVMMAAIHHRSHTGGLIKAGGRFTVHLLDEDQADLARRFGLTSGHKKDKFEGLTTTISGGGLPVLPQTLGYLECRVIDQVVVHDHTVFFGEVVEERLFREGRPLMFFRPDYSARKK